MCLVCPENSREEATVVIAAGWGSVIGDVVSVVSGGVGNELDFAL